MRCGRAKGEPNAIGFIGVHSPVVRVAIHVGESIVETESTDSFQVLCATQTDDGEFESEVFCEDRVVGDACAGGEYFMGEGEELCGGDGVVGGGARKDGGSWSGRFNRGFNYLQIKIVINNV